jgi:hypothetical protein
MRKGTLSPSRQEEYLASMEDGLRRVQRIVRQLLDFSQQHNPELALADINQVVNRVLLLTDHLFVPHRVQLETALSPDHPGADDRSAYDGAGVDESCVECHSSDAERWSPDHSYVDGRGALPGSDSGFRLRHFFLGVAADISTRSSPPKMKEKAPGLACLSAWALWNGMEGRFLSRAKSGKGPPLPSPFRLRRNDTPSGGFRERA